MNVEYTTALTIAGFDGSGGAGIQADLKTFSALECYGLTVLTAMPIQNTQGVKKIYKIPPECILEQLETIFEDIKVDNIKIGMLHSLEIIEIVANFLKRHLPKNIVLDPVMTAKNHSSLLEANGIKFIENKLFPIANLITPNLPEASKFLGKNISSKNEMKKAALELQSKGPVAVFLKGGHLIGDFCDDILCVEQECYWFPSTKIQTNNTHGTGCTLSAAITAFLARGYEIVEAVDKAKKYVTQCIKDGASLKLGYGHGPLHHFSSLWKS